MSPAETVRSAVATTAASWHGADMYGQTRPGEMIGFFLSSLAEAGRARRYMLRHGKDVRTLRWHFLSLSGAQFHGCVCKRLGRVLP